MRSIKFSLFSSLFGLCLCLFVFTSVRAWTVPAAPMQAPAQAQQEKSNQPQQPTPDQMQAGQNQDQPQQNQAQSSTFTGTIVKDGELFVLKAPSGDIYKLDDSSKAQPFEGKPVKVTGKLVDSDAKLIHVENIEALSA